MSKKTGEGGIVMIISPFYINFILLSDHLMRAHKVDDMVDALTLFYFIFHTTAQKTSPFY